MTTNFMRNISLDKGVFVRWRNLIFLLACAVVLFAANVCHADDKASGAFLQRDAGKIYFEECGTGPNVVLLHDGLAHAVTWDAVWGELCSKYHVVRYDRPGYGRSDAPKSKFSPTEDLRSIMQRVNMPDAVIAGNSSGGALAIDFALAHPEMVKGLFLVGPVIHGMRSTQHFADRGDRNQQPLQKGDSKAAALNWSRDEYLIGRGHDAARKTFYDAIVGYPQNLTYDGQFEIRPESPAIFHLSEIKAPTFVIVGEFDIPDVHAHCGVIDAEVPFAKREIVSGDGHLIQLEDPKGFLERFEPFADLQNRKSIGVAAPVLSPYQGTYLAGQTPLTITLEAEQLRLGIPGRVPIPLFAETPAKFFTRIGKIDLEFIKDPSGNITEMIVNNGGNVIHCPRRP